MFTDVTEKNCKKLTGLNFEELIGITGIYGIHEKRYVGLLIKVKRPHFLATFSDESVVVEFSTSLVKDLHVRIDLYHKTVTNILFEAKKSGNGIAFPRLYSQVHYAQKAGFKTIKLTAWGDYKHIKKYSGYIVWGKYGFLMVDPEQKEKFFTIVKKDKRADTLLYYLLQTTAGVELWKKQGFYWYGEFDLTDESISMMILNNEVNKGRNTKRIKIKHRNF
jgi:hypothetical protein